jgi:hypothetical protein
MKIGRMLIQNFVQFWTRLRCYGSLEKSGASKMHVHARGWHLHHHESLTAVRGFKLRNSVEFCRFNLELGSDAMGHLGSLMHPKCMFIPSDHISTTANPWQECAVLNCENQQNFAPKIWFNLEPGSGTTDHQGNPALPKCMSMLGPIPTPVKPQPAYYNQSCFTILPEKFGPI